jgi:mono/diheme cytochrome c family protein
LTRTKRRILITISALILALGWFSRPLTLSQADLPEHQPDLANGERMFHAGGCAACHGELVDGKPHGTRMAGGLQLNSPAGMFRVPNISPHPESGIGKWGDLEFINAMQQGVSPAGRHYYPSFPYTSYARMRYEDLIDLKAYLDSLPAVDYQVPDHELSFPFEFRRAIGLWKRLYLDPKPVITIDETEPKLVLGRYLIEGPGHCGECHTPRNRALATLRDQWLSGAPLLEGKGKAPNITATKDGISTWSESDIRYYLETGIDPDFDVVGGPMVAVQENMAMLSTDDRAAIAAYLKVAPVNGEGSP